MQPKLTFEEIKQWKALDKMDNADADMYKFRIKEAYTVDLPHKNLTLIPYVGTKELVNYDYPELVALCPVTFFPDIYNLKITIIPDRLLPELKSLKFYYMDYYHLPISHEHLASKIYNEIWEQIAPKHMQLELVANVRGGIASTVRLGDDSLWV